MLTIEPPVSCCCIQWLARCEQKIAANRLSATIRSVKRGVAVVVSAGGDPPALFTSTSRRPSCSTTESTIAHAASPSRRSTPNHVHPSGSASGSLREHTATVAPASAKRCAMPRPTPLVPPVTSTTMPSKSSSMAIGVPYLAWCEVNVDGPVTRLALDRPDRRNALSLETDARGRARAGRPRRLVRGGRRRGTRPGLLRRSRSRRDDRARRRLLRRAVRGVHRDDAAPPRAAAAGHRPRARRRDRGGLSAGRRVRSRGRGRHRHLRDTRRAHRPVLLDADGAAVTRDRPQAGAADAPHRRADRRRRPRSTGVS